MLNSRIFPYLLPLSISLLFVALTHTGHLWTGPLLVFLAALIFGRSGKFKSEELILEYDLFHHSRSFENLKVLNGVFFILFNIWTGWFLFEHQLPTWLFLIFIYSVIILNSNFSVALAHELMHAESKLGRFLGMILLLINGFFYLEADHIYIHHRHVGTVSDPASARLGESVYAYLFRSIPARFLLVFGFGETFPEAKRKSIIQGNILRAFVCVAVLLTSWFTSSQVFLWLLLQFIFATLIYEVITYIQHYGLRREASSDGKFEMVSLNHSWNCYYKVSTYLNFMMPVHSIHHLKVEPNLKELTQVGPEFPKPFRQMVIAAFYPPYWFRLMNDRVRDVTSRRSGE